MVLLVLGIILAAVGAVGASINVGQTVQSVFRGETPFGDALGDLWKRQGVFGALFVIGVALIALGLVAAIF